MHIIYIANTRIPNQKAHGFQIGKSCEKFAALGNTVELWYPDRKNDIKDDIFTYYNLKRNFKTVAIPCFDAVALSGTIGKLGFYLQSILFSLKLLSRHIEKGTVVYTRDIFTVVLFYLRGIKTVYNVHNWSSNRAFFAHLFLNNKQKIVCNSEGTKAAVAKDGFVNAIAVANGVDLEEYENLGDKITCRQKMGLPSEKTIVLYTGHFYKWKGTDVILDSARMLGNTKDIVFVIVGDTKQTSAGNIIFTGHKPKKDMPLYLKSADVLLLPNVPTTDESVSYTSPLKMFEYMASGVPIVASNLPSIREVLNTNNAVLVQAGEASAIVDGIQTVLADSAGSQKRAQQALQDVKKFTWDEYAKKILAFIQL